MEAKVTHWIKGTDDNYYKNPTLELEFFKVLFRENFPPEIIIDDLTVPQNRSDRYRIAADLLKSLNIKAGSLHYGVTAMRLFREFDFRHTYSMFFTLKGPLPVEYITSKQGIRSYNMHTP